jgi:hypothetical protein
LLFSNVNPTLEFSGFDGEPKKEMYNKLPDHLYPETIKKRQTDFKMALKVELYKENEIIVLLLLCGSL